MHRFSIAAASLTLKEGLQHKIDTKTKPIGALGRLEELVLKVGLIQETLEPQIVRPSVVIFAGDHGIVAEAVTAYPQEVTTQMVQNFLDGGAAINIFARQYRLELLIVNSGIVGDIRDTSRLLNIPIGKGTKNFLLEPAMSIEECELAIDRGADVVNDRHATGCNVIAFGEMGIGNTSSAAMIMSNICNLPVADCVGRGAGLNDEQLIKKRGILEEAANKHGIVQDPKQILATYGGFETAMLVGAMLQAAELKMVVLIDGFIVTSALLIAHAMYPDILDYCIFSHASNEQAHIRMLKYLDAEPLFTLDLRLGEGTGAALAFPLVKASVLFINEMASFESAHVSEKY